MKPSGNLTLAIVILLISYGFLVNLFASNMLHGLGYGVSDTGIDPSVRLAKPITLENSDTVQNLGQDIRTHLFTCETCNF